MLEELFALRTYWRAGGFGQETGRVQSADGCVGISNLEVKSSSTGMPFWKVQQVSYVIIGYLPVSTHTTTYHLADRECVQS